MKYLNTQSYIECIKKSNILEVISYDPIRPSCNNRCKFCITKDCTIPPQPVEELHLASTLQYKWIKDIIIPQLKENNLLDIKCNFQMIGGELFYLPQEYYEEYYNWLETGWNLLNPILKKKPIVNLFTNLLFSKETFGIILLNIFLEYFIFLKFNFINFFINNLICIFIQLIRI